MLFLYLVLLMLFLVGARLYPRYMEYAGKKALSESKYDSAIAILQQNTSQEAESLLQEAYLARGKALLDEGKYSDASADFERAGERALDEATLSRLRAGIATERMADGQYAEAKRYLSLIASDPTAYSLLVECNYHLAEQAFSSGDADKALLLLGENGQDEASKQLSMRIRVEKARALLAAEENDACETLVLSLLDEGADVQDIYLELLRRKDMERFENATEEDILTYYTEQQEKEQAQVTQQEELKKTLKSGVLAVGNDHTVALKSDGTVMATGDNSYGQCNVQNWTNIVAVAAGAYHTVGLRADGTLVAVGDDRYGQCQVSGITDVVCIAAHTFDSVAQKKDGSLICIGRNKFVAPGTPLPVLTSISLGSYALVGLKDDGTAYSTRPSMINDSFRSITMIDAGTDYAAAVRFDGTIVTTALSTPTYAEALVLDACSSGIFVLLENKTVRFWSFRYGDDNSFDWTDVCAIAASGTHFVVMKDDGTFAAKGKNNSGQCDVGDWQYNG